MHRRSTCLSILLLTLGLCFSAPRDAAAIDLNEVDVAGRSYLTVVSFIDLFNGDCFQFGEDDEFTGSMGLLIGTWEPDSETFALFFTVNFVTVELLSATEATITAITAFDNAIIVGLIETDDGDGGFFLGFESMICAFPARTTENSPLKPIPDNTVPSRMAR